MSESKQCACVRYGFWHDGYGVSVWRDDMHMADLSAGLRYTWEFILDECGGDHAAAREAVCGLAVIAACNGMEWSRLGH